MLRGARNPGGHLALHAPEAVVSHIPAEGFEESAKEFHTPIGRINGDLVPVEMQPKLPQKESLRPQFEGVAQDLKVSCGPHKADRCRAGCRLARLLF